MNTPLPPFVVPLCVAAGVLLIMGGIPLYLRRVPPNPLYGVRLRATRDERIWYEINARAGRDLVVIGAVYLCLLGFTTWFGQSWIPAFKVLGPLVVLIVGLIADTIMVTTAASRLAGDH